MKCLKYTVVVTTLILIAGSASAANLKLYHVVKNGDTISRIAHSYGTTVNVLNKLNKLNKLKNDKIFINSHLEVPWPDAQLRNAKHINVIDHQVLPGDNLGSIAQLYGSHALSIKLLNKLRDFRIKIGQKVTVPTTGPMKKREILDYTIKAGDSAASIAAKYNLLQRVIRHLNPGVNMKSLRLGQAIKVVRFITNDIKKNPTITPVNPSPKASKARNTPVIIPLKKPTRSTSLPAVPPRTLSELVSQKKGTAHNLQPVPAPVAKPMKKGNKTAAPLKR
jgi:LysM repeat protein